jgi:hypothetical protein
VTPSRSVITIDLFASLATNKSAATAAVRGQGRKRLPTTQTDTRVVGSLMKA